jgi:hypothetical protein
MAAPPTGNAAQQAADALIRINRDLLALAEEARRHSQALVLRSSLDRIQRCLNGVRRDPVWALGMAEWAAGQRHHPPRGKPPPMLSWPTR